MKNNIIKKSLSVIIISLLMCLVFVSCKSNNKDVSIPDKVVENNQENEKEVSDVEKPVEEEKTDVTEDEKVEVEQKEESQPVNQENQGNENVEVTEEEEDSYGEIICIVNDVYLNNGKKYIDVDQVEFFIGAEAYSEAGKDGNLSKDENGNDFLANGYYIRNNYNIIETYEVNEESSVNLCIYVVDPSSMGNASETVPVAYEEFESYVNNSKGLDSRSRMFWVNTKNNVVEKIEMQYTP